MVQPINITDSQSSVGAPMACRNIPHSKISSSSKRLRTLRDCDLNLGQAPEQGAALVARSGLMKISINDFPDDVLVEILCRVGSYEFRNRCMCVSKRWCNLMSGPRYISRFLCIQSEKQAPIKRSLLTYGGEEYLRIMSSSTKPLRPLFEKLMSFHSLEQEPIIVCTYNDLVLCCASRFYQHEYYICNPSTIQWVPLPLPPQVYKDTATGFICDIPYYNCRTDDQGGHVIELNSEYRCRVLRICIDNDRINSNEFKVQIFSSETGEWTETTLISPSPFDMINIDSTTSYGCYAYNGMLYWDICWLLTRTSLIGLNPFGISGTNSISYGSTDTKGDHYNYVSTSLEQYRLLGLYRGCLRVYKYEEETCTLTVVDLKDEEIHGRAVKLCLEKHRRVYSLDKEMIQPYYFWNYVSILGFNPNDDDILYLKRDFLDSDIVECNLRTRKWSVIVQEGEIKRSDFKDFFPLDLPWWPTPVPKLAQHSQRNPTYHA